MAFNIQNAWRSVDDDRRMEFVVVEEGIARRRHFRLDCYWPGFPFDACLERNAIDSRHELNVTSGQPFVSFAQVDMCRLAFLTVDVYFERELFFRRNIGGTHDRLYPHLMIRAF